MSDQIFAREMAPGSWQWSKCSADEHGDPVAYDSGDSDALVEASASASQINLVLHGQQVVATEVELDPKQRRHAAKLIPYELEEELSSLVDDLHFAFTPAAAESKMSVLYTDRDACATTFDSLSEKGCDVRLALPDYLLLKREEDGISLLLDQQTLTVRVSEHWGFAIEEDLAEILIKRLAEHSALSEEPPASIALYANSEEDIQRLASWLPEAWSAIRTTKQFGSFWDCVALDGDVSNLNLRRGKLARRFPYEQWWKIWKLPAYFLVGAVVISIMVNLAAYTAGKSQEKAVRENINSVYLDAVPNGRLGDVERMLQAKLGSSKKVSSEPTNAVYLISKVTGIIFADKATNLTSYTYNGEQRALQLTLKFTSLEALGEFRAKLQSLGIESDSPRTTSDSDGGYQARMKIREAQ